MSPYRRNVMVGATILVALAALGWLIVQFGGRLLTPFTPPRVHIRFITERADGLGDGSPVLYRGVNVVQVTGVTRGPEQKNGHMQVPVEAVPPLQSHLQ